jgi:hypothetical protein
MVLVADFFRKGEEHAPVNASMLYILSNVFKKEEILFISLPSHIAAVKSFLLAKNLQIENIRYKEEPVKRFPAPSFYMKRVLNELWYVFMYNKKATKEKPTLFFFLSLTPFPSMVFHRFFYKDHYPAVINLHGELEFIKLESTKSRNYLGRCYIKSFKTKHEKIKYLVIDDLIKRNLLKTNYLPKERIVCIPQPYTFKTKTFNSNNVNAKPITIGMIGVASIEKNSQLIFDLAKRLENDIKAGLIKFVIVGKNENIPPALQNPLVEFIGKEGLLARTEFEENISKLQFSIFFYQNNSYQFTTSGAVLDAIDFEKPIIALRNDLFETLCETAGKIGFLCDSIDEICKLIGELTERGVDGSVYDEMRENMKKYKEENTLEAISKTLSSQIKLIK